MESGSANGGRRRNMATLQMDDKVEMAHSDMDREGVALCCRIQFELKRLQCMYTDDQVLKLQFSTFLNYNISQTDGTDWKRE